MKRSTPPTPSPVPTPASTPVSPPDFTPRATVLFAIGLLALPAVLVERTPTSAPAPALGAASPAWETVETPDGSHATRRHEAGGVVVGDELYLLGGRGRPPLERWPAANGGWENLGPAPLELHHFQPVDIDGRIHVVGAFTCCYPNEAAVAEIHVFDTASGTWDVAGAMPPDRVRGSTAAVAREGRLYVLGGNTRGHDGGAVPWFDVWDPASGRWTTLPDAPHARDHFTAAVVGDTLVAAAGRTSTLPNPSANPVLPTDLYDFRSGTWRTVAPIPTPRAGTVTLALGDEAIVIGGELNTAPRALDAVEAFDVASETWRTLPSLRDGRHGSGAGVVGGALHVVAGATSRGGATETQAHERLVVDASGGDGGGVGGEGSGTDEQDGGDDGASDDGAGTDGQDGGGDGGQADAGGSDGGGQDGSSTGADGEPGSGESGDGGHDGDGGSGDGDDAGGLDEGDGSTDGSASPPAGDADRSRRRGGLGGGGWLLPVLLGTVLSRSRRMRGARYPRPADRPTTEARTRSSPFSRRSA